MIGWLQRLLLLLSLSAASSHAAKILVYNPKFAFSHQHFLGRIADELVEGGHDVTSLIPVIDASLSDGPRLSSIIHVPPAPEAAAMVTQLMSAELDFFEIDPTNLNAILTNGNQNRRQFTAQCRATLKEPGLLKRLKKENYDVVIAEAFDYCGIGISELIGAKSLVTVSSTALFIHMAEDAGIPLMPAYNIFMVERSSDVRSFWWRLKNVYHQFVGLHFFRLIVNGEQALFDELYGPAAPKLTEVAGRSAFTLVNSDPLIDFAVPTLARIVPIGGIAVAEPKNLSKEWNATLSLRPRTILVSFGSIAKSVLLKIERKRALLQAFSRFPSITFVWKYEKPEDDFCKKEVAAVKNVVITKWMPQNDLLNDHRISAFISHGGMASVQEISTRGVPAIFVPIFGDQVRNSAALQHIETALLFDKRDLDNAEKLADAIEQILEPRYSLAASRISQMLAARPLSPRSSLLAHVSFAASFGGAEALLRPLPAHANLGFIARHSIDVLLFLLAAATAVALAVAFLTYSVIRACLQVASVSKVKVN